jgi:tripartite-type tricarboxylate transporter receptor subunit TctC
MQVLAVDATNRKGGVMKFIRRRFLSVAAVTIVGLVASPVVWAQTYPARPVRVIVPFAPGGATDIIARPILQELSKRIGQQFYIENIPGGGGNIGTGQAAKAASDGYTILFAFSSHVTNPSMFDRVPYDPLKDFAPITLAVTSPAVVSVHPSLPAKTLADLIALIKANPGKYSFASGGIGTQPHLAGEQLRMSLGLDLVHVPYNGGGPALISAVAGHTPISFSTLSPAVPQIKGGKLRALAVTSKTRSQTVPDVPTMAEAGYPDIEGDTWVGVLAPAGTENHIVTLLNREIVKILSVPATKERLVELGYEPVGNTPGEYAAQIRTDIAKWAKIIRSAGIRPQ